MSHVKDAYYFSHDSNARNDKKISEMRSAYGAEGYGWYWMLIEMLREEAGYRLHIGSKYAWNAIALQLQCTPDAAQKFVSDCIEEFKLFNSDRDHFWSESLLRRMEKMEKKSEKARQAARERWRKAKDDANALQEQCTRNAEVDADALQGQCVRNAMKVKESKEKQSKEKESTKELAKPVPDTEDRVQPDAPSNQEIIAELVGFLRDIKTFPPSKGDYGFIGRLYNKHGYDRVLDAINDLGFRMDGGFRPDKPLIYLKGIIENEGANKARAPTGSVGSGWANCKTAAQVEAERQEHIKKRYGEESRDSPTQ